MAPEQELNERNRRRRPAADWGVAEDIFDRMPSRRFKRGRAESQEIVIRRADTGAEAEWVDEGPAVAGWEDAASRREADVWIDDEPRQAVDTWAQEAPRRGAPRRSTGAWAEGEPRRAGDGAPPRGLDVWVEPGPGRTVDSW